MELSIIIVNWNTRDLLEQCLRSIFEHAPEFEFDVWVVDNASSDGSVKMLADVFPQVNLIQNPENLGFARANNAGIRACSGNLVLLLNSDTIAKSGSIQAMHDFMGRHLEVGAIGPKLVNPDGTFQASYADFPTLFGEISSMAGLSRILIGPYAPSPNPSPYDRPRPVDWVAGAALLVRRSVIEKTGGFDESYFLYSEETDWCYRIWKAGFQIWYVPEIEIVHYGGASTRMRSVNSYILLYKSKLHFFESNYGEKKAIQLRRAFHFLSSAKLAAFGLFAFVGALIKRKAELKRLYEREKALSAYLGSVEIPLQPDA